MKDIRKHLIKKLWKQNKQNTSVILMHGAGVLQFQSLWVTKSAEARKIIFSNYNSIF